MNGEVYAPVYAEHDQHVGGEDEAAGPHHHQNLTHKVAGVPLKHITQKITLKLEIEKFEEIV